MIRKLVRSGRLWILRLSGACEVCGRQIPRREPDHWYRRRWTCRECCKQILHTVAYGGRPKVLSEAEVRELLALLDREHERRRQ